MSPVTQLMVGVSGLTTVQSMAELHPGKTDGRIHHANAEPFSRSVFFNTWTRMMSFLAYSARSANWNG